jgi:hypothetical protein
MKDKIEVILPGEKCADLGCFGCLEIPDDRYTMDFQDVGGISIKYCASCGPKNARLKEALEAAFEIKGPEFKQRVFDALASAEEAVKGRNS